MQMENQIVEENTLVVRDKQEVKIYKKRKAWEEFVEIVTPLVEHEKVQEMKQYPHHGVTSCFEHCIHVSYCNFMICKMFGLDAKAGARAGLLHDLFLYDWHTYKPNKGERLHGFTHARQALINAEKYFELSDMEKDIISKHMFPLNLGLPKYKETSVIILTDKFCGFVETVQARLMLHSFLQKTHKIG